MGRKTSEMFRAVSSRREDRREGQFHKCFGQFPGMEDRGEESFRHVSGSPRGGSRIEHEQVSDGVQKSFRNAS